MKFLTKAGLILRRVGFTFVLAFAVVGLVGCYDPDVAGILFVPLWAASFFMWPYLERKLNFKFPRISRPRPRRSTAWGRVVVTGLIAFGAAVGLALLPVGDFSGLAAPVLWIALYYGWPRLSRILPLPEAWKVKDQASETPEIAKRNIWQLLGRGVLAMISVIMAMFLLPAMTIMAPIGHSMERAHRVHDSIHVGMTLPEVLEASTDCDLFAAGSEFPDDQNADGGDIPAICRTRDRDGLYRVHDVAAHRDIALTQAQEVERLHRRLHDGYRWRFAYTYLNITPMHVSFSVIFGPDGRVAELTPVHGWD